MNFLGGKKKRGEIFDPLKVLQVARILVMVGAAHIKRVGTVNRKCYEAPAGDEHR